MMDDDLESQLRRKLVYAARMLEQVTMERDIAQKELDEAEAESEWLVWFYQEADFGPAHEDVLKEMKRRYKVKTGNHLPRGYSDPDGNE